MTDSRLALAFLLCGAFAASASPPLSLGPPLDPALTVPADPAVKAAALADYRGRLADAGGAATLVPLGDPAPEKPAVIVVPGHGMNWQDLAGIAGLRDDYQLFVACYDTHVPLTAAGDAVARILVDGAPLWADAPGGRRLRVVGHSYGAGVAALALDRLRRGGFAGGPAPLFDNGLAVLIEAPWRGADFPWPVRVPGVQRAMLFVARKLFGRDVDPGSRSTFNHATAMKALVAAGVPETVEVDLVTTREGLAPGGKFRHYGPTHNWYPEELGKGEWSAVLRFLAGDSEDPDDLETWTVPLWNRRKGLANLYRALRLDKDFGARIPALRAALRRARARGASPGEQASLYEAALKDVVDTFAGDHTAFMWEDPRFTPWLRSRLAEFDAARVRP